MAFNAIDNTRVNAAKHQDDWYAAEVVAGKEIPYASLAAAYTAIPSAVRMKGRSFLVTENGLTVEYWWKDDLTTAIPKGTQSSDVALRTTISGLRAMTGTLRSNSYQITDKGKEGLFFLVPGTFTSANDNTGTFIVDADGRGYSRPYTEALFSWFDVKGDGVTNDTVAFQRALNSEAEYLKGTNGESYLLGQIKVPSNKNISLFGTKIKLDPAFTGTLYDWFKIGDIVDYYKNEATSISIIENNPKITIPTASSLSLGDIVMIVGGKHASDQGDYNFGHYSEVISITGTTVEVSNPPIETFTATKIYAYKSVRNVHINGLNMDTNGIENVGCISMQAGINCSISNPTITGKNSVVAINATGINIQINAPSISGFTKVAFNGAGYGIALAGHGVKINGGNMVDCKHAATSGSRLFMSTGIIYDSVVAYGTILSPIDMHGNTRNSKIIDCEVFTDGTTLGITVRDRSIDLIRNTIRMNIPNAVSSSIAISCFDMFDGYCTFEGNTIVGTNTQNTFEICRISVAPSLTLTNFNYTKNQSNTGVLNIAATTVIGSGVNILNNDFDAVTGESGRLSAGDGALKIKGNKFQNKIVSGFNFSIGLGATLTSYSNTEICDNEIYMFNNISNSQIRVSYNGVKCYNNTIFSENTSATHLYTDFTTTKNNLFYNNKRKDAANNYYTYTYSALPTPSAFFEGYTVLLLNIIKNDPYICLRTANTTWTWISADLTTLQAISFTQNGIIADAFDVKSLTKPGSYTRGTGNNNLAIYGYPFDGFPACEIQVSQSNLGFISMRFHTVTNRIFYMFKSGGVWTTPVELTLLRGGYKTYNATVQILLSDYGNNGRLVAYLDATAGAFTVGLLAAAVDLGLTTSFVKTDASANTITIKAAGTELINNANTDTTLSTQNASFILESNGTKHFKF